MEEPIPLPLNRNVKSQPAFSGTILLPVPLPMKNSASPARKSIPVPIPLPLNAKNKLPLPKKAEENTSPKPLSPFASPFTSPAISPTISSSQSETRPLKAPIRGIAAFIAQRQARLYGTTDINPILPENALQMTKNNQQTAPLQNTKDKEEMFFPYSNINPISTLPPQQRMKRIYIEDEEGNDILQEIPDGEMLLTLNGLSYKDDIEVNMPDLDGDELQKACMNNNISKLTSILSKKQILDFSKDSPSTLLYSLTNTNLEVCERLFNHDIQAVIRMIKDVADYLMKSKNLLVIHLLTERKISVEYFILKAVEYSYKDFFISYKKQIDINKNYKLFNVEAYELITPLAYACRLKNIDMMRFLKEELGAKIINSELTEFLTFEKLTSQEDNIVANIINDFFPSFLTDEKINQKNIDGREPLLLSIFIGFKTFKTLLLKSTKHNIDEVMEKIDQARTIKQDIKQNMKKLLIERQSVLRA
jgi:hypothetical protein